ncbi:MAG: 6,7-dimethyl-8-ribityllumazine synthase [Acidobacteriota bacterium]
MPKVIQGNLDAKNLRFGIIVSRFNEFVSERLLEGALDCLERHGAEEKNISIFKVPGCFEIPLFAKRIADTKKHDAIICLGVLIRGETPHFDFLSAEVTKGIASVGMETGMPVIFGVLTSENLDQAIERAGAKSGNKGWMTALSAIEMANLYRAAKA